MSSSNELLPLTFKKLHGKAILPTRQTTHSAGYDLYAIEDGIVPAFGVYHANGKNGAMGRAMIPLGFSMRIPPGKYGRIAPRSSLAWRNAIDVGGGVIDEDYNGEICVILFNHSSDPFEYKAGERISQLIIETVHTNYQPKWVDELPTLETNRTGGFGSTNIKSEISSVEKK